MPATLLHLDLDIIAGILAEMEPTDALQMAFTCRAAYRVAHPRALSDITIDSNWQKDGRDWVDMFSSYMLERPHERIPHLKSLTIESDAFAVGGSDPETGEKYVDFNFTSAVPLSMVVQLASRLQKLCIGGSEFVFGSVPELAEAIASLTSLRELSMSHVGTLAADVLSKMRSRPRSVECSIISLASKEETRRHTRFVPGRHHLLHNFIASLEVLRLENADILRLLECNTVWPHVHELSFNACGIGLDLVYLGKAFPNVRRLEASGVSEGPVEDAVLWPKLDHLTVLPTSLHILSRVRSVSLFLRIGTLGRNFAVSMRASNILEVTKPVILDAIDSPELFKCVASCLVARTLKFIRVYIPRSLARAPLVAQEVTSLDKWIRDVTPLMKRIALRGLAIVTQGQTLRDRDEYARRILSSHSTLEYVAFATRNKAETPSWADDVAYVWYRAVARPENEPPVIELLGDSAGNAAYQSLLETPLL